MKSHKIDHILVFKRTVKSKYKYPLDTLDVNDRFVVKKQLSHLLVARFSVRKGGEKVGSQLALSETVYIFGEPHEPCQPNARPFNRSLHRIGRPS